VKELSRPSPATAAGSSSTQQRRVVEEFSRRAEAFATAPVLTSASTLDRLVQMSNAGPRDTALDVACGAGLVVCAFAEVVQAAAGIDLTPAMIQRAQLLQRQKGLTNVSWQVGDVVPLPFADESFSIVSCRYALHHMENPAAVVSEMVRVCARGGRVVLADMYASSNPVKAAAFNRMEQRRDGSHVRAMPLSELEALIHAAGLRRLQLAFYGLDWELETVLQGSSINTEEADVIRRIFSEDLESDRMSVNTRRQGSSIWFTYPIVVMVAEKAREPYPPPSSATPLPSEASS
jgi:ubiquinone/menaquinone biosynthesis C-methylase UbiE